MPTTTIATMESSANMKDGSDFLFYEDDAMSDADSEDGSHDDESEGSDDDDDDDDDEGMNAAEALLRGLQERRSELSLVSMGSKSDSFGSSSGSITKLFGQPGHRVEERMTEKSAKKMQSQGLTQSSSNPNLQAFVQNLQNQSAATFGQTMGARSISSAQLDIQQTVSSQQVHMDDGAMKPDDHLAKLLGGTPQRFSFRDDALDGFFLPSKPEYVAAWTGELVKAVREHDLPALERMHHKGEFLQACNEFGESIIHLTVRRGTPEMLRFLLQDAGVSMRVCCDLGRTPLHDAAWCLANSQKSFIMMALLLTECPMQLLITDKRGFTPLAYVPRSIWAECNAFLDRQFAKGRFASLVVK